jgi:tripartite-type tricarboxylate transporter receptor subunit TctC
VFAEKRLASLPDVPTVKESGYDITLGTYNLVLVPKGVPENRLALLRRGFIEMLNDPEMVKDAANRSLQLFPLDGDALMTTAKKDADATKDVLKDLGLAK